MSVRAARWILWVTFVLAIPVPFWMVVTGWVPAARLLMLSGVGAAIILAEGTQGVVGLVTGMLVGQAAIALIVWWLVAALLARLLGRLPRARLAAATILIVATCLVMASAVELYHTPFRSDAPRANLLHVFD